VSEGLRVPITHSQSLSARAFPRIWVRGEGSHKNMLENCPLEYLDSVDEAQFDAVGGDVRQADGVVVGGGLADVSQREARTLCPTVENRHEQHKE